MLTKKDFQDAVEVSNACNASGVIVSLAEMMSRINDECRELHVERDTHPVMIMFVGKIDQLVFHDENLDNWDMWDKAYRYCQIRAGEGYKSGPVWSPEAGYA
jgi:glutamate dehydrogenase/leucine dehydrogenase